MRHNRRSHTKYDLSVALDIHHRTAQRHLKELHALDLIYIASWEKEYQQWIPSYKWTQKRQDDAPRPEPLTGAECTARYRETPECVRAARALQRIMATRTPTA